MARSIPHQPQGVPARSRARGQAPFDSLASWRTRAEVRRRGRGTGPHSPHGDRRSQYSIFRVQIRILSTVSNPVPDARRAGPGIAWKERRTAPRHAAVWVRIGGKWQQGRIIEWVREIDRDGWDCVIMADEPVSGPPWQGRYAFDPRSIRPRDTEQPPADLAGAE